MIHYNSVVESVNSENSDDDSSSLSLLSLIVFIWHSLTSHYLTLPYNTGISGSDVNPATGPPVPRSPGHMDKHCDGLDNEESHEEP